MQKKSQEIISEIKKVIVGKDEIVKRVFMAILSKGHVLLDDIPGVGKTTLALSFSLVLGLDFQRLQCTPDTTPSDIVGYSFYRKGASELEYKPGAVMCNLLLADEINRTSAKTQSALLEAMQEGNVTVDGATHPLPEPFMVIATQNPFGSAGTQLLPQSQLDRFALCLGMGYPDFDSHVQILKDRDREKPLKNVNKVLSIADLIQMQHEVDSVLVQDSIFEYITRLAEATRENPDIALGLSPRGALSTLKTAKAGAYIMGRDYLVPGDIADIFSYAAAHRIIISPKAKIAGTTTAEIVEKIINTTKTPAFQI